MMLFSLMCYAGVVLFGAYMRFYAPVEPACYDKPQPQPRESFSQMMLAQKNLRLVDVNVNCIDNKKIYNRTTTTTTRARRDINPAKINAAADLGCDRDAHVDGKSYGNGNGSDMAINPNTRALPLPRRRFTLKRPDFSNIHP